MPYVRSLAFACIAAVSATPAAARAQVTLDVGHIDFVDVRFLGTAAPQLEIGIHDHDNDVEYVTSGAPGATDWALLSVKQAAVFARPAGAAFDPIGVAAGANFWWLKNPQNPNTLFGGLAAEEVPPASVGSYSETDPRVNAAGRWVKVTMTATRGPGAVSMWSESGGTPTFWFATSDGITAQDSAFVLAGGHVDYNFGFTAAGDYELDLRATAFDAALQPIGSAVTTLQFTVVPEPSSLALLGLASAGGAGWAGRRFRARRLTGNVRRLT